LLESCNIPVDWAGQLDWITETGIIQTGNPVDVPGSEPTATSIAFNIPVRVSLKGVPG